MMQRIGSHHRRSIGTNGNNEPRSPTPRRNNTDPSNPSSSSSSSTLDASSAADSTTDHGDASTSHHTADGLGGLRETSGGGGSGGGGGGSSSKNDALNEVQMLARRETQEVQCWRIVVIVTIIITGALVATGTYTFLKREQYDDYMTGYQLFAKTIKGGIEFHTYTLNRAFTSLSELITAHAWTTGATWPFVTLPSFEVEAGNTRAKTGVEVFSLCPIVAEGAMRRLWGDYSVRHQGWVQESQQVQTIRSGGLITEDDYIQGNITPFIHTMWEPEVLYNGSEPLLPVWQTSPPPFDSTVMVNHQLLAAPYLPQLYRAMLQTQDSVFAPVSDLQRLSGTAMTPEVHQTFHEQFVLHNPDNNITSAYDHPHTVMMQPVFASPTSKSNISALIAAALPIDWFMTELLPNGVYGIRVVVANSCGQAFTYEIHGNMAMYLGPGDKHEQEYTDTEVVIHLGAARNFAAAAAAGSGKSNNYTRETMAVEGHCMYTFHVYSSSTFQSFYSDSNLPMVFTYCVAATFLISALSFFMYDWFVARRNTKLLQAASRSNAIVSSLFPSNVRDRILADETPQGTKSRLRNFLSTDDDSNDEQREQGGSGGGSGGGGGGGGDDDEDGGFKSKPIADLFPNTTVLFADIAGFTAWSSVREPSQVFILLETVYHAFDDIANKRRVFKVETVGDCYVAVAGLPDPRKDHAVVMSRFSRDCMHRMNQLTKRLEVSLGPDTGDLCMRMGIHSGPVTAGVLRGERSRFQLFGDTMNTASRMESTGTKNRIQISQETADLLVAAGKSHWIKPRDDLVIAKGKGEMQTYWLDMDNSDASSSLSARSEHSSAIPLTIRPQHTPGAPANGATAGGSSGNNGHVISGKSLRLIEWNCDVLLRLLRQIVARRSAAASGQEERPVAPMEFGEDHMVLDEVVEIITLPQFDPVAARNQADPDSIEFHPAVVEQLHNYVSNIAAMYQENPFHNFEHASHVTMSVVKLLSRIVAPSEILDFEGRSKAERSLLDHDHTYGITSDPLTQFGCVLSALIHDCDHYGVSNAQLVKEGASIATFYKNKSVLEQNSVDLAWQLLMEDVYSDLRETIYSNEAEKQRFRQLVVNSVMATDILDQDLKSLRNARWEKAFKESSSSDDARDAINRKATIVIEHLIQASDVSHTMQHWHIYRKWNERFYMEMHNAYVAGRAAKDPADFWYQGEIGFFDFYIIPLAKKLKDCGVFGVSSDEYLNYAMKNRQEWEARGVDVVNEMRERAREITQAEQQQQTMLQSVVGNTGQQ